MKTTIPNKIVPSPSGRPKEINFIFGASATAVFFTILFASKLVIMQGQNGEIRNFFTAQAKSILNGTFEVNPGDLPTECYISGGKCFGYFGITPSLLRIPLLLLGKDFGFTPSYLISALLAGLIASCLILYQASSLLEFWSNARKNGDTDVKVSTKKSYILLLIMICPGSLLLQLTRPAGQWEVIAWSSSLTLFALLFVLKWYQTPHTHNLVLGLLFFILAANARVTSGLIAVGVSLICLNRLRRLHLTSKLTQIVLLIAMGTLPILTTLMVLYLKFKTFFPNLVLHEQVPEAAHWASILQTNGGKSVGLVFFLTNFMTYLRPDSIVLFNWDLIPVRPNLLPVTNLYPLPSGGMYHEPSSSVTNLIPISLVMFAYVTLYRTKRLAQFGRGTIQPINHFVFVRKLCVTALSGLFITLTFVTSSNRYLGDFVPATLMFTVLGCLMLMMSREYRETKLIFYFLATLISFGVLMNIFSALTRARLGMA